MKGLRPAVLLLAAAGLLPAGIQAQVGHDFVGGLISRSVAPAVPRFASAIGALCVVLPEDLPAPSRSRALVVGVVEGRIPPSQLEAVLARGGAREEAADLSRALVGIMSRPRQGQGADAIRHYNALVRASSDAFLLSPPPEFLHIHEIVRYISTGAPPAREWVCAEYVPPEEPPLPRPPEEPVEVCVMIDDELRLITATYFPESRDTLVGTVQFRVAHPLVAPSYAAAAPWFTQTDSLRFTAELPAEQQEEQLYVRFGLTRRMQPEQLRRVGRHQGTVLFAEVGAQAPYPALYVPVRPGCILQPYQFRPRPRG
jgi:hypothetical protein